MLGLPKSTEVNKQLPQNAIYANFKMNTAAKERIDKDIPVFISSTKSRLRKSI